MKTNELAGAALDWAVAKCENSDWSDEDCIVNVTTFSEDDGTICNYSTDWAQGGAIIEREKIKLGWVVNHWGAQKDFNYNKSFYGRDPQHPLTAAMRCFVASKLGDEVEIPEELTA